MKRFFFNFAAFLLGFACLDRVFVLFKPADTNIFGDAAREKMTKARNYFKTAAAPPLIVIGSSHAQFGIDPKELEKTWGAPAYNLGFGGGTSPCSQYDLLRYYLNDLRKPVRRILYAIDVFSLNSKETAQELDFFRPKPAVRWSNLSASIPYWSLAYRYSSSVAGYPLDILKGNWRPPLLRDQKYDLSMFRKYEGYEVAPSGWVIGHGVLNPSYVRYADLKFLPDPEAVSKLEALVDLVHGRGIELSLIQIPEHFSARNYRTKYTCFSRWMRNFTASHDVHYQDFDSEDSFPLKEDRLFFDSDHLNKEGAKEFSTLLAQTLGPRRDIGSIDERRTQLTIPQR